MLIDLLSRADQKQVFLKTVDIDKGSSRITRILVFLLNNIDRMGGLVLGSIYKK